MGRGPELDLGAAGGEFGVGLAEIAILDDLGFSFVNLCQLVQNCVQN